MRFYTAILAGLLCFSLYSSDHLLTAVYTSKAPAIDGKPLGEIWDKASWGGNPVYLNANEISPILDMRTGVLWDSEALYVGFKVKLPRSPRAVTSRDAKGDDGLERDDAVEVTLFIPGFSDTKHKGEVVQFKLNVLGQRDDGIHFDFNWNGQWDGAVSQDGLFYYATFKLPFKNFGVTPKVGDQWGANFGAYMAGYDYRAFLWTPVNTGHHHQVDSLGTLVFGDGNTPASSIKSIAKGMDSVTVSGDYRGIVPGTVRLLLLEKESSEDKKTISGGFLVVDFDDETQKPLKQAVLELNKPGPWSISLDNLPAGSYKLKTIVMYGDRKQINVDVKPLTIDRAVEVKLLPYHVRGSADAKITVHHLGSEAIKAKSVKVVLTEQSGEKVFAQTFPYNGKVLTVNFGELKNSHTYNVEVTASGGGRSITQKEVLVMKVRPVWADTKVGLSEKIPAPWGALSYNNKVLSGTGKEFRWDKSLFPDQVSSNRYPVIAGEIEVKVAGDKGEERFIKAKQFEVKSSNNGMNYSFEAVSNGDLCDVKTVSQVDFDGFVTIKLTVSPKTPLNKLSVKIPLGKSASQFIQPLPGAKNRDQSGDIPVTGVGLDRVNNIWLSSPDAGLYFGIESFEKWIAPKAQAAQIWPTLFGADFVLNFYDDKQAFEQEREYLFFLQIAPLRPYSDRRWSDGPVVNNLTWGHNVTPLAYDAVKRLKPDWKNAGSLKLKLRNYNDLYSIARIDFDHWVANEKILAIGEDVELLYSQADRAIVLKTPQGRIVGKAPCDWKPDGDHDITIHWGDEIALAIDGKTVGTLPVKGNVFAGKELTLGSISARYRLDELALDGQKLLDSPLELRSYPRSVLSEIKKSGAGTLIFFEHWCSAQNGGRSIYEPILRNVVEDVHAAGMKVIFYFGFEMADVPEHADMLAECKRLVDQSANYYAPARQNTYFVSYGGPYMEYLLYHMDRLKKELGIDGVYLDGTLALSESDNPAYGAGFTDSDGKRHTSVPIRRIREFAQRMNNLFVQPGGIIFAHVPMSPPTIGYISSAYLGEHLGLLNLPWESMDELIPRESAINLYAGKNTGVPMTLCIQNMWPHLRGIRPRWYQRSSTWAELNRIELNVLLEIPMYKFGLHELKRAKALKEFGADNATWLPYWELSGKLKPNNNALLCSAYIHGSDSGYLTIYNSGKDAVKDGSLDLGVLFDLTDKKVTEVISGKPVKTEGSKIHFDAPGFEGISILVK
ncbi:MAG: DUF6067 family protein [Victivallales bacterium]|jgi:hypothetical protein|nr:DUF6067 family protein [Victivallales bacterium]